MDIEVLRENKKGLSDIYGINIDPIRIELKEISESFLESSLDLKLLYVCKGKFRVNMKGKSYSIKENKFLLINYQEVYKIQSEEKGIIMMISINIKKLEKYLPEIGVELYNNYKELQSRNEFNKLKNCIADILELELNYIENLSNSKTSKKRITNWTYGFELLGKIQDAFGILEENIYLKNVHILEEEIVYIFKHYSENLNAREAAKRCHFSISYFSKLFKDVIGMSYGRYLNKIRFENSIILMKETEKSLQEIAEKCGFLNIRAFSGQFRMEYGVIPSIYRKNLEDEEYKVKYFENIFSIKMLISILREEINEELKLPKVIYIPVYNIDMNVLATDFKHVWQKSIGIGMAHSILDAQNQKILKMIQQEIGFEKVALHNLLSDSMMVCSRDMNGKLVFNFSYIDRVFDFLISINLKPMVQLGYMPQVLAMEDARILNNGKTIISFPRKISEWKELIKMLVRHLIERYGSDEVETWEFCLWTKPEAIKLPFGFKDVKKYFDFYYITWNEIKSINKKLVFGSPAFIVGKDMNYLWISEFLSLCKDNYCLPDNIAINHYPMINNKLNDKTKNINNQIDQDPMNMGYVYEKSYMKKSLENFLLYLKNLNYSYKDFRVEEWNSTISYREILNDTMYKSSYIIENVLDCRNLVYDMSYWGYYDFIGEDMLKDDTLHGGIGLCAYGGIKKPAYYAMLFLSKLGDKVIFEKDGCIVTQRKDKYQILLYNYCEFSKGYAEGNEKTTLENAYSIFHEMNSRHFYLNIINLEEGEWLYREEILNREVGSVYDNWISMGANRNLSSVDIEYLIAISQPKIIYGRCEVKENTYNINILMKPFEIRLIEVYKKI